MESFAYGSLAQIRILLLPVGNIRRSAFDSYAQDIRSIDTVGLADLTTDVKDERSRFMPNHQLASGSLHLKYPSHPPPDSHTPLSLFRTADFPLAVLGIASSVPNDSLATILSQFQTAVHDVFPQGSMFPLTSNCFVFEENESTTNINLGDHFPGLVVIPSVMGHKKTYIGTLVADLCSKVLIELATVMQTLESPLGNEYLNATMFPHLPPSSEMPRSLDDDARRDSLPLLPSHSSQPDLNGQQRAKTPLGMKRTSTLGPGLMPNRHSSLPPTPAIGSKTSTTASTKKRLTTIGAASSHGRLFKVLADYFLLAGRLEEASIWYNESIVLCKTAQDVAWHAAALEGLATIPIVEAWSSSHGINGVAGDRDPWADPSDKLTQAMALYMKATPTSEPEVTLSLLAYLYCSSVLRHSTLLYSLWSSKGWGPLAFAAMLQPGPSPFLPPTLSNGASPTERSSARNSYAAYERLTTITGVTRAQISASISQAHGPWLNHLDIRERVRMLEYIAAMFGALGHIRKEAYTLREVLGCLMDMVVCGREESSTGSARVLSAGLGNRNNSLNVATAQGTVGIRENERSEGNESILYIVKHVCKVHGIDLEAVKLLEPRHPGRDSRASEDCEDEDTDEDLARSLQEPFGWPELQMDIIREAIAVAEALPDYPAVAQFSFSALKLLHPVMTARDQHQLYTTGTRALATAMRRGDRRAVDYWSSQPVVSLEVLPLPLVRLPVEKPISILSRAAAGATSIISGVRDPFLYNPRKMLQGQTRTILVQNEAFDLVVTLRNPYVFDLELQNLQLSTSGVTFVSKGFPVVVPANSFHPVTINGKATEAGTLVVRGCIVQAQGGISREFVLPLSTEEEEERKSRRRSAIECETGRSKHSGLASRPWEKSSKRGSTQVTATNAAPAKRVIKYLECVVVPEQPLLRIRRTSLTHGAVMLYNGEMSAIRITLENVSSLPIDLVRLTFDDSTIGPGQQALAEGEMSVFDTYETEYDLVHRPVFTWDAEHEPQEIGPGQKKVVAVNCFGKVGCTNGAIHVSYAYVDRAQDNPKELADVFQTRQLSYPVLVTVYHMLECHAMDILSYSGATTTLSPGVKDDEELTDARIRKSILHVGDIADWCIFSIEVRNTYGLPFEVTFERHQEGVEAASITTLVPPGSTSRIVLPLKKLSLSEEHVSRPIPMLSDRQYVVSSSKLSPEEERSQRELFWYREELFKSVRGKWRENGGTRAGDLSLRQQRMTLPMLEALRVETARVRMTLVQHDDNGNEKPIPLDPAGVKYMPPPHEFVYLRTTVTNLSPSELVLMLNLELDPEAHVVTQGELVDIPIGRLARGESYEVETPLAFIACGRFDFGAEVSAIGRQPDFTIVGHGRMRISVA
ncbi:TRAPP II complex [Epithele typhae]|uniref:TRAPP II complex n=1 Tax=Epithele typhae TaxID=378194 RepID=UPI0020089837|nr:TRAPP II complex [Epithele typhae]KAH9946027.1 TRAPP II complex [Epithele typhae]